MQNSFLKKLKLFHKILRVLLGLTTAMYIVYVFHKILINLQTLKLQRALLAQHCVIRFCEGEQDKICNEIETCKSCSLAKTAAVCCLASCQEGYDVVVAEHAETKSFSVFIFRVALEQKPNVQQRIYFHCWCGIYVCYLFHVVDYDNKFSVEN